MNTASPKSFTSTWKGYLTATSSISHIGETLGTVSYLRREKILTPDNTVIDIPIVSGNSVRGRWRDIAADLWWWHTNKPALPLPVAHAIWSGGSLVKASGELLTGKRLLDVENLCPVINIFGAAGGGRIINGNLNVSKAIPICRETFHLLPNHTNLPDTVTDRAKTSFWDLLQIEYYTRNNQTFTFEQTDTWSERERKPHTEPSRGEQMRYGVETFLPGTMFHLSATMWAGNPAGLSLLSETLQHYAQNGHLGGKTSIGHGTVTTTWYEKPVWFNSEEETAPSWRDTVPEQFTADDYAILARLQ